MPEVRYITDWLDAWAAVQPHKKLFGFVAANGSERDGYTYARFAKVTRRLATWLRDQGLEWGDRVVLAYPAGLNLITAFFACARAGIIAVPSVRPPAIEEKSGGTALARILAIAADCGAHVVLTDQPSARLGSTAGPRWLGTTGIGTDDSVLDTVGKPAAGTNIGQHVVDYERCSFADTPSPVLFFNIPQARRETRVA
jgi:acyl-CoA synthetase (AMP-forming)/AMP-acid ligase II